MAKFFKRNNSEKKCPFQLVTDRIIDALKNGSVPWKKPWKTAGIMPMNMISKKPYRGTNLFLLGFVACYSSPYWLTFKQATEKGGHVKKGEKGWPVVFWRFIEKADPTESDPNRKKRIPFLKYSTVFNLEQCEGIANPDVLADNEKLNFIPIERAEAIVDGMPNRPVIKHGHRGAFYHTREDFVGMPNKESFFSVEEYYSTLFHELAHATGHDSKLKRFEPNAPVIFGNTEYSKEELIAEIAAAFLCAESGIEVTFDNSVAYIQGWLKKLQDDPRMVVYAATAAQKACKFILNEQEPVADANTNNDSESDDSDDSDAADAA